MCFLTLCDRGFNKKLAYSFLEDLSQEFYSQYGHKINTATRPYSFIEFGQCKSWSNLELNSVQAHKKFLLFRCALFRCLRVMHAREIPTKQLTQPLPPKSLRSLRPSREKRPFIMHRPPCRPKFFPLAGTSLVPLKTGPSFLCHIVDTYIQKAKRTYVSSGGGRRQINHLNSELQDVQRIMVQNIDDVLQRGAVLSGKGPHAQSIATTV